MPLHPLSTDVEYDPRTWRGGMEGAQVSWAGLWERRRGAFARGLREPRSLSATKKPESDREA